MSASPDRPVPVVTAESAAYWAAGLDGRLLLGICDDCGRLHHPPQRVCPHCWFSPAGTVAASGRGTVHAFSVVHRNATRAFRDRVPYVVAYVELDDGPHLTTNIVNVEPDDVGIGMRVRAVFEEVSEEVAVPLFEPLEG